MFFILNVATGRIFVEHFLFFHFSFTLEKGSWKWKTTEEAEPEENEREQNYRNYVELPKMMLREMILSN